MCQGFQVPPRNIDVLGREGGYFCALSQSRASNTQGTPPVSKEPCLCPWG